MQKRRHYGFDLACDSYDDMVRGLCDFIGAQKSFGRRDTMFFVM